MKFKYLILIIFLGFLLRIINISQNSLPLYGDELTIVYDAYSILKTGQDQLGNIFPLTFEMGAGRPAGYVYFTVPFVALFGPTALGVRLPSVLSGLGIILLFYLLGEKLFSRKVGLAAAILAALSPWTIQLSRVGYEANFALLLVLSGTYFFIIASRPYYYLISAFFFGLVLHTYPTYKISLIFFLPFLFWFVFKKESLNFRKKTLLISIIIFAFFAASSITQTFIGGSEARFLNINIFSQEDLKNKLEEKINYERTITNLPQNLAKYFHNKPTEYGKIILENYLQNFSLDFLLIHGDRNPRHNMSTMGQIFLAEAILILIGLLSYWQREKRTLVFLLGWLLIAPIATSIVDLPHALRSSFMIPPLLLISSLGFTTFISLKNKPMLILLGCIFLIQFVFFIQKLYFLAPNEYSHFWSYSAKQATEIALENKNNYDYIILSDKIDNIEFAYPVYAKIEPQNVIAQNQGRKVELNGAPFKQFGNIYIGYLNENGLEDFIKGISGSILTITTPESSKNLSNYEIINGSNNLPSLVLSRK